MIIEPVQGEGGARAVPDVCLRGLRALCDELFDPESVRAKAGGFPAPKTREMLAGVLAAEGRGRIWAEAGA